MKPAWMILHLVWFSTSIMIDVYGQNSSVDQEENTTDLLRTIEEDKTPIKTESISLTTSSKAPIAENQDQQSTISSSSSSSTKQIATNIVPFSKTSQSLSPTTTVTIIEPTSSKPTPAPLHATFKKLDWLVGKWRGEFSGKVFWPTIPTMNYGEELIIEEAPVAKSSGVRFLNFSARAWSHTTKDQLHDEWGFMTINDLGNVTLMTAGNNGFTTYEEGWVDGSQLVLRLKKIGRISFSRDLPVEDIERRFKRLDKTYLEQALRMRTATHPRVGLLDHTTIIYEKKTT